MEEICVPRKQVISKMPEARWHIQQHRYEVKLPCGKPSAASTVATTAGYGSATSAYGT